MANAIMGLWAETSIHAGASTSEGVIDLPIQREAHTDWPVVYGSGVKGALRAAALDRNISNIDEIFGPDTDNAADHAGALSVGDARLLLLPVRSLTTHFKWVTCPALLTRLQRDWKRMEVTGASPIPNIPNLDDKNSVLVAQSPGSNRLFLEELSFEATEDDLVKKWAEFLPYILDKNASSSLSEQLQEQLAIISNDNFVYLAKFATPVSTHIAIDNEKKVVKKGALWYEEILPSETILYSCIQAERSRKNGSQTTGPEIMEHVKNIFEGRPYLQIGGNETVGMGWCKVTLISNDTEGGH